jgi:heme A synthase
MATLATLVPLLVILAVCIVALRRATPGTGVRLLVMAALVAVMIQGLLGGLRVRLNELVGADLALIHGVFATVVLSMLVAIAVLTARGPTEALPFEIRRKLGVLAWSLVAFTLVQIVFGAMVRHTPNALGARLHLLIAFLVVGLVILVIKQANADPASRRRLKWPARILMALIAIQVVFGVEAWMGKFMTVVPIEAQKAPTLGQAILRTAHAHVGAWILAVGVVFALVVRRQPAEQVGPASTSSVNWQDAIPRHAAMSVRSPA